MRVASGALILWLIVGAFAAGQRNYYTATGRELQSGGHYRGDDPGRPPQLLRHEPADRLPDTSAQQVGPGSPPEFTRPRGT